MKFNLIFVLSLMFGARAFAAACDDAKLLPFWGKWSSERLDYQLDCAPGSGSLHFVLNVWESRSNPPMNGMWRWTKWYHVDYTLVPGTNNTVKLQGYCQGNPYAAGVIDTVAKTLTLDNAKFDDDCTEREIAFYQTLLGEKLSHGKEVNTHPDVYPVNALVEQDMTKP